MDLKSGYPFWPIKDGIPSSFPALSEDIETDIAVLGGGISGALTAYALAKAGLRVAVVDKRHIAAGSTSASTALLQYEIDVPLRELIEKIGKRDAERAYHACAESIPRIAEAARATADGCAYADRPSMCIAHSEQDVRLLYIEYEARLSAGFDVSWLDNARLHSEYGMHAAGAIRSELAGEVDPYSLTHSILSSLQDNGHHVFELTEIVGIETENGIVLTSAAGRMIRAKKLVFATGYESQEYLKEKIVSLRSSYALVTEPLEEKDMWKDRALIWDTAKPYLYARTTPDHRMLIGGGDIAFRSGFVRDLLIPRKAKRLVRDLAAYIGERDITIGYEWAGTFGETKDGLAYIGISPEWKDCYFNLGFGGNGITYSMLGSDLITRHLLNDTSDDLRIFRFGR